MKREYMKKYGDFFCGFWQLAAISKPQRNISGRWGFTVEVKNFDSEVSRRAARFLSFLGLEYIRLESPSEDFFWVDLETEVTQ